MIKEWKEFMSWMNNKKAIANKSKEYFINSYNVPEFWQKVVQDCNDNPDLVVELRMADGTTVKFSTMRKSDIIHRPTFNGRE